MVLKRDQDALLYFHVKKIIGLIKSIYINKLIKYVKIRLFIRFMILIYEKIIKEITPINV